MFFLKFAVDLITNIIRVSLFDLISIVAKNNNIFNSKMMIENLVVGADLLIIKIYCWNN